MNRRFLVILYSFIVGAVLLSGCSDWRDGIADDPQNAQEQEIAFSGSVVSSKMATRANLTIVKLGDTALPTTANSGFHVGIFGAHTGQKTWEELTTSYKAGYTTYATRVGAANASMGGYQASPEFAAFKATDDGKAYTAGLLYNAKATVETGGVLTYEPVRFWPNTPLKSPATGHEYCTFWAYYPWNASAEVGDYGITLIDENIGQGTGLGRVKFTMQPDAAERNDFMISDPVVDCNRDTHPLVEEPQGTYEPKPVRFRFHHMLAQVRIYAYIRGNDRMVYVQEGGKDKLADATWFDSWPDNGTITDQFGNVYTKKGADLVEQTTRKEGLTAEQITEYNCGDLTKAQFVALGLKVPDESQCQRWERSTVWDRTHKRRRALISYQMEFNNIKTTTTFYPDYTGGSATIAYEPATTLGSATVKDYIMNPYWYKLTAEGQRSYLDDDYMFNYFEDTEAWKTDGNALVYTLDEKNEDKTKTYEDETHYKHYNFAQGNVLLVVPQKLDDDDVPHIVLTAKGPKSGTYDPSHPETATEYTARLTINMLKMNIEWKSGYIYCYGILDDLRPGDDIVRGPESITTIFDTSQYTDQW